MTCIELQEGDKVRVTRILKDTVDSKNTFYEYPKDVDRIITMLDFDEFDYPRAMATVLFENEFVIDRIGNPSYQYKYSLRPTAETEKKIRRLDDSNDFFDDFQCCLYNASFCIEDLELAKLDFKKIKALLQE